MTTMDTNLSTVDALTMALSAAGILRSSGDPEAALANAYAALDLPPPASPAPLAVRIVQLVLDAGPNRPLLAQYLRRVEGPLAWDRPATPAEEQVELVREDAEATRYKDLLNQDSLGPGHSMFWRGDPYPYYPSFRLLERASVLYFHGPTVVMREGQKMPPRRAVPPETGDKWTYELLELPAKVKGLVTYPFEVATLFDVEAGCSPWNVWDICCAFSDQYMKLYEHPEKHGIWGSDLSSLWIEDLIYFPEHQLIYPHVGS
jgi:hypothetical protein